MEPLLDDVCNGCIHGFSVLNYPKGIVVEGYNSPTLETVRVLLLCWTGDQPGRCEVGKLLNQG